MENHKNWCPPQGSLLGPLLFDTYVKAHIKEQLNKACAKASALWSLRKFTSKDVLVHLYKAYVLSHLEYCSPLLLGVGKAETTKIETTNYFTSILRTTLGYSMSVSYAGSEINFLIQVPTGDQV